MADFEKKVGLIEIKIDNAAALKQVENFSSAILESNDAIKDNSEAVKALAKDSKKLEELAKEGIVSRKDANREIVINNKQVDVLRKSNLSLKDGIKDLNKERAAAVKATKLQSDSLDALRAKSIQQKKALNGMSTAGKDATEAFNVLQKELKETNDKIKELDQGAGDFKTTVGDYPDKLEGATDGLNSMSGGALESAKSMKSLIIQTLKFMATPVGLVLAAIAGAFLLVKNAMDRSEGSSNKVTKAMSALGGIFNTVLKALEPLGNFLIDNIVVAFELAGEAAEKAMALIGDGLRFLGFDEAAESVDNFTESLKEGVAIAEQLAEAEAKLVAQQRESTKTQLDFQKEAEKLRQIRDDEALSIAARIKANNELGEVLKRQFAEEKAIVDLAIQTADLRIQLEGETSDNLDRRAEALTELADLEERITGQESEQLVNINSLRKEAADKRKEESDAAIAQIEKEAAVKAADLESDKEAAAEALAIRKSLNTKLLDLADFKRQQENETNLGQAEDLQAYYDLLQEIENENFEIDQERLLGEAEKIKEDDTVTEEEKLGLLAENQLAIEELEAMHAANVIGIKEEQANEELAIEAKKQAKYKGFADKAKSILAMGLDEANNIVDNKYKKRFSDLDKQFANGEITERQYNIRKINLERHNAMESYRIQKAAFIANKVISLVEIAINTAKGVSQALGSFPPPASFVLAAATGILGAAQGVVVATKKPPPPPSFAEGGVVINGKSHAQGGEDVHVGGRLVGNMQGDEGLFVTKKEATKRMLDDYNTSAGGRSMFASSVTHAAQGGALNQQAEAQNTRQIIADTVAAMPVPEVPVTSIMGGLNAEQDALQTGVV